MRAKTIDGDARSANRPPAVTTNMTRDEALAKLISVRHCCFVRGILGQAPDSDFRQALRTINRLYVEVRDRLEVQSDIRKAGARRRRSADCTPPHVVSGAQSSKGKLQKVLLRS
jgi:hypothetical protein